MNVPKTTYYLIIATEQEIGILMSEKFPAGTATVLQQKNTIGKQKKTLKKSRE